MTTCTHFCKAHDVKHKNFKNLFGELGKGAPYGLPPFCLGMPLCLHLVGSVWFHAGEVLYMGGEGIKPP